MIVNVLMKFTEIPPFLAMLFQAFIIPGSVASYLGSKLGLDLEDIWTGLKSGTAASRILVRV